jgi:glutamyl/glutaminyl-tRNA synthetase
MSLSAYEPLDLHKIGEEDEAIRRLLLALDRTSRLRIGPKDQSWKAIGGSEQPVRPPFPNARPKITEEFKSFFAAVRERERTLDQAHSDGNSIPSSAGLRIPKFLIFVRAGEFILAIVDEKHSVDELSLQPTDQPRASSKIHRGSIERLGFDHGFAHPFFKDRTSVFHRIIIDGLLLFQYIYFPLSRIRIPIVVDGVERKEDVYIGAFIRQLEHQHGTPRILFANISKRSWPDRLLMDQIRGVNCLTRFAPTPSNSLHLGNVRSALIPYLLARKNVSKNAFVLRFDDTNRVASSERFIDVIRSDLQWLGFQLEQTLEFRQSAKERQRLYEDALRLLRISNRLRTMVVDGEECEVLALHEGEAQFFFWLDWNRGPIIAHRAPGRFVLNDMDEITSADALSDQEDRYDHEIEGHPTIEAAGHLQVILESSKATKNPDESVGSQKKYVWRTGDLTLTWGNERGYRYKFAGIVDDVLHFSHVVRDLRQEELTARQALIRYAIYKAWSEYGPGNSEIGQHLLAERVSWDTKTRPAPFKFPSPPIYVHVPILTDEAGLVLSKRDLQAAFSIEFCRSTAGFFLPETVISFVASTLVHSRSSIAALMGRKKRKKKIRSVNEEMASLAGRLGAAIFLDVLAANFSLDWLRTKRRPIRVSAMAMLRQERYVIRHIGFSQFQRQIEMASKQHSNPGLQIDLDVVMRAYQHRTEFASWRELVSCFLFDGRISSAATLEFEKAREALESISKMPPSSVRSKLEEVVSPKKKGNQKDRISLLRSIRLAILGKVDGPRISVLLTVLGEKAIRDRILVTLTEMRAL